MRNKLSKQRAYQLRQRAKGLCTLCPSPIWRPGSSYCRAHLDRHLAYKKWRRENRAMEVDRPGEGA